MRVIMNWRCDEKLSWKMIVFDAACDEEQCGPASKTLEQEAHSEREALDAMN